MNILGINLEEKIRGSLLENLDGDFYFENNSNSVEHCIENSKYNLIIVDIDGLGDLEKTKTVIEKIITFQSKAIVITLGERATLDFIAWAIQLGIYDYLLKPIEDIDVINIVTKALRDQKMKAEKVKKKDETQGTVIGNTAKMVEVYKKIGKVATNKIPVLISGEKGNGKKAIAQSIHSFSCLKQQPFVSVNCTAYQKEFLDRKLFGHEQGSMFESQVDQIGILEKGNGGSIHLGNIESLDLTLQAKILGLLHEGAFFRVGGSKMIKVDIRIIATTSENIEELIMNGKFIGELYQRLRILEIEVPPLRERKDDIPLLIHHFMVKYNENFSKDVQGVSTPAMKKIMRYDWPGNVRELKSAVKAAMVLSREKSILVEDLPANIIGNKTSKRRGDIQDWILSDWVEGEIQMLQGLNQRDYYGNVISRVERELIKQVLEVANGKKVEAAETLGITRNTLRTKMNNYDLD
ncbi:MAG: sigma-54-dependent Fis family transcriptional regulator [Psychrilyobacter sp.]|nr:sigma-54-dependent Fis family transcriptional regulator [Psychrilyobacter sp.]